MNTLSQQVEGPVKRKCREISWIDFTGQVRSLTKLKVERWFWEEDMWKIWLWWLLRERTLQYFLLFVTKHEPDQTIEQSNRSYQGPQCFQGSRGERVAATSCHPPLQTFTVSSLPILSFRAPWLVGGCPNDLSLDWGARRIEAPRGWTSYGVGRIDLWLPYKDRLTFLSTVIFINISHRSTGEIWSLKLRVTTLIRPTRKVQM